MAVSPEEIQEKLEKWLSDEGYSITKGKENNNLFSYAFTLKGSPTFTVLQPKAKKDSIAVATSLALGLEESKFQKMPEKEKEEMLWNLKMLLLRSGCNYIFSPPGKPFNIQFYKAVYYDGLSKNSFFEAVDIVLRAFLIALMTLQQKGFGVKPPEERKSTDYVS